MAKIDLLCDLNEQESFAFDPILLLAFNEVVSQVDDISIPVGGIRLQVATRIDLVTASGQLGQIAGQTRASNVTRSRVVYHESCKQ